jgi:2-iminobutanoate/2-iminopropanoate deaminase
MGDIRMTIKTIYSKQAPDPIGPYSQAIQVGDFLFTSGQIAIESKTGKIVPGGVEEQTTQVLKNIEAVLKSAGLTMRQVVKTTIYITNMDDFVPVNQIYAAYFKDNKPARSTVEVSRLPKDVRIEIECVAYSGKSL